MTTPHYLERCWPVYILHKPLSIAAIDELCSTPGCTHITLENSTNPIAFDIHTLRQCLQQHQQTQHGNIIEMLDSLQNLIKEKQQQKETSQSSAHIEIIADQKLAIQMLIHYHQSLKNIKNTDEWLNIFLEFFNTLIQASFHDIEEQHQRNITHVLQQFLLQFNHWSKEKVGQPFFYQSCKNYLQYHCVPSSPPSTHVYLLSLDEARYLSAQTIAVIGVPNFTLSRSTSKSIS